MILLAAQFHWRPWTSPLHIFAAAGVLAVLALVAYGRTFRGRPGLSAGLLLMRLCVIAAMAVLLLGPSELPPKDAGTAKPLLGVLLDTSRSMAVADCDGRARIGAATADWLGDAQRDRLAEENQLELLGFGSDVRALRVEQLAGGRALAADRASLLADAVRKSVLRLGGGGGKAALLVLSDGRATDRDALHEAARLAKARGVAVFAVCFGGPTLQHDLQLVALPRQEFLLAGEPGQIVARIHQAGYDQATTTLVVEGGGEPVRREVRFEGKPSVTVEVPIRQDKPGLYEYNVRVEPAPGEQETANNVQRVFCSVTDQHIRVLLLEGQPFWDTKFIAQSLRKDERVELTQITRISLARQEAIQTRTTAAAQVPRTAEAMGAYDVVILGGGMEHLLNGETVAALGEFVSRGGGHLIFARGRSYDPQTPAGRQMGRDLAVLEPVVWTPGTARNQALSLTAEGRANPCFSFAQLAMETGEAISRLPGFQIMPRIEREKTAAQVLARAAAPALARSSDGTAGDPAIVAMDYGRGRVVAILGEGLWQWAFLPPESKQFDGVYDAFWSNLVRWLATSGTFEPGTDVSMKLSRSAVQLGGTVLLEVSTRGEPPAGMALAVTDPQGKAVPLTLAPVAGERRLQAQFQPAAAGVHELTLEAPGATPARIQRRFGVYDLDTEGLNTSADPEAMALLAEESGGAALGTGDAGRLAGLLGRRRAAVEEPQRPYYVWDKALVLIVLLGWIGGEWLLRRRAGLL